MPLSRKATCFARQRLCLSKLQSCELDGLCRRHVQWHDAFTSISRLLWKTRTIYRKSSWRQPQTLPFCQRENSSPRICLGRCSDLKQRAGLGRQSSLAWPGSCQDQSYYELQKGRVNREASWGLAWEVWVASLNVSSTRHHTTIPLWHYQWRNCCSHGASERLTVCRTLLISLHRSVCSKRRRCKIRSRRGWP